MGRTGEKGQKQDRDQRERTSPTNGWTLLPERAGDQLWQALVAGEATHETQRSAFSNLISFAASEVKLYLTFFRPNGLVGSTAKIVLDLGGFLDSAGPYS